jgi:general secretion pathway protein A
VGEYRRRFRACEIEPAVAGSEMTADKNRFGTTATLPSAAAAESVGIVETHWHLVRHPFGFIPDPDFVFASDGFREALARVLYNVVELRGGLTLVTGESGVGKTTLAHTLLRELPRDRYRAALLVNPPANASAFLGALLRELGLDVPRTMAERADAFASYLRASAERAVDPVLLVDEAQRLAKTALDELRALMTLEADDRKLFHVVLLGLPELANRVRALAPLDGRVTMRARLGALSSEEVRFYVEHRMKVAGSMGGSIAESAHARLAAASGGIPRRINAIAAGALAAGVAAKARVVTSAPVDAAVTDLDAPVEEEG